MVALPHFVPSQEFRAARREAHAAEVEQKRKERELKRALRDFIRGR